MIVNNSSRVPQAFQADKSEKAQKIEQIKEVHQQTKAENISRIMAQVQGILESKKPDNSFEVQYEEFQNFLKEVGYEGKAIASLSQEEASELVSEDGFFGVTQTSERIAQFVISGANADETLLKEGRKGILQGFKEAEALWGGKLPDIAYETIDKAVAMIDKALAENGFSIVDEKA